MPSWEPLGLDPNLLGTSHLYFAQVHSCAEQKEFACALLITVSIVIHKSPWQRAGVGGTALGRELSLTQEGRGGRAREN